MGEVRERPLVFYARVAGCIYLGAMAVSIFSQTHVLGRIVVPASAAATAVNIAQSGTLFRSGIALDVVTFASDVVIAWAFYELLRGVDRGLALLGAFLRIADAAILAVTTVSGLVTLRLLSGASYLDAFSSALELQRELALRADEAITLQLIDRESAALGDAGTGLNRH